MLIFLRLIHIVLGVFWVGSVIFLSRFLVPAARAVQPAGPQLMRHLTEVKQMPKILLMSGWLSIFAGFGLFYIDSAGFTSEWMKSGQATVLSIGATLAIISAFIGMMVNAPTARKIGALGGAIQASGGAPTPEQLAEMQRLQARMAGATNLVATLLTLCVATMAVARYVG